MAPGLSGRSADLAIIGSYPPPYGGVATHVSRLIGLLSKRGVKWVVYNAVSDANDGERVVSVAAWRRTWLLYYAMSCRERCIYILSDRLLVWLVGAAIHWWRGKRVIVRLRNVALPGMARRPVARLLAGLALRNIDCVIAVSKELAESARSVGVREDRVSCCPGFLPPDVGKTDEDLINPEVWSFMGTHTPCIAANGKVNWHEGVDLYGLDLMVELTARLRKKHPGLGLVVCFWDHKPGDELYLAGLKDRAATLGVKDHIMFNTKPGLFVPVLAKADVFVRPTNTDGDATSIREALYLGVAAVASDSVERPEGTTVFRSRDLEDFIAKTAEVLDRSQAPPKLTTNDSEVSRYLDLLCATGSGPTGIAVTKPG